MTIDKNMGVQPAFDASQSNIQAVLNRGKLREALRRIAYLRPAGDLNGIRLKDAQRLIEQIECIALDALGEGL